MVTNGPNPDITTAAVASVFNTWENHVDRYPASLPSSMEIEYNIKSIILEFDYQPRSYQYWEDILSHYNSRTLNIDKLRDYHLAKYTLLPLLQTLYNKTEYRKYRYHKYKNTQRSEQDMIKRFTERF